ncbi:MAG: hypothetical protein WHV26_08950 [Spirochaetota bacterium]
MKYKIVKDDFLEYDSDDALSQVGIVNGTKARSKDYGLCLIIDDGSEFEQLGLIQLRLEYNYFTIPFNTVNNTIKGMRYGFTVNIGMNILSFESNSLYAALTTGLYHSQGNSSINNTDYQVLELPLGIVVGNKIKVSQNSAIVLSVTYNFYNHFINNNENFLVGFSRANNSVLSFATGRNEFIINCSYVYQFGDIFI